MSDNKTTMLDYLIASGYRKFDAHAIDVPAFHHGVGEGKPEPIRAGLLPEYARSRYLSRDSHSREFWPLRRHRVRSFSLPTRLPRELGKFNTLLADGSQAPELDALTKLALLLTYSARPLRWEPQNTYPIHRGIASARCLFSCSVRIAFREPGSGLYRLYAYEPNHHLLRALSAVPEEIPCFEGAPLVIAIVGDLASHFVPYGEFAPSLCFVEGGLLLGQILYLLEAMGSKPKTRLMLSRRQEVGAQLYMEDWNQFPLSLLLLPDSIPESFCAETEDMELYLPEAHREGLLRSGNLRDYLRTLDVEDDELACLRSVSAQRVSDRTFLPWRDGLPENGRGILETVRRRNSGSYLIGFVPRGEGLGQRQLDTLLDDWMRLAQQILPQEVAAIEVATCVSVLKIKDTQRGRYEVDFQRGSRAFHADDTLVELHASASTMPLSNFQELNLVVTFSCDFAEESQQGGSLSFLLAHTYTGYLAACFGLAAARQDMFSRPVRMYDDAILESGLKLRGQSTLQLLCGFNRGGRLAFDLL